MACVGAEAQEAATQQDTVAAPAPKPAACGNSVLMEILRASVQTQPQGHVTAGQFRDSPDRICELRAWLSNPNKCAVLQVSDIGVECAGSVPLSKAGGEATEAPAQP